MQTELPVFEVQRASNGALVGAMAVSAVAPRNLPRLDPRDLPAMPQRSAPKLG